MDRQQDCEESDGELRLFTVTHTLVHASGTTATTTRPRKRQKKDSAILVLTCFVPGRTAGPLQDVQEGPYGLVKDGHVLV